MRGVGGGWPTTDNFKSIDYIFTLAILSLALGARPKRGALPGPQEHIGGAPTAWRTPGTSASHPPRWRTPPEGTWRSRVAFATRDDRNGRSQTTAPKARVRPQEQVRGAPTAWRAPHTSALLPPQVAYATRGGSRRLGRGYPPQAFSTGGEGSDSRPSSCKHMTNRWGSLPRTESSMHPMQTRKQAPGHRTNAHRTAATKRSNNSREATTLAFSTRRKAKIEPTGGPGC